MVEKITTREAADYLGLSTNFVLKLCQRKRLKAEKDDNGYWQIDKESVNDYQPITKLVITSPDELDIDEAWKVYVKLGLFTRLQGF